MAKLGRKRRKKKRKKIEASSPNASLAAMAPVIESKGIFDRIHEGVKIPQKTIDYRPTDKLVFVILSQLAGGQTLSDINWTIRVDKPLLSAFGYTACPDQSTIQDTLDAATADNVVQLRQVVESLFGRYNLLSNLFSSSTESSEKWITIDCDLSGQPASKRAENSTKGYFATRKNAHGRQLARLCVAETAEIVVDRLYPGNTTSCAVFKEMILHLEEVLNLEHKQTKARIRLRLDGGFGTDENINWALSRGYHLLAKMYCGNRARKLAQSVCQWVSAPTALQKSSGEPATREVGWVTTVHRYCRKTRQLAIRTPNAKAKSGYRYAVVVTTDLTASLETVLSDYDKRSGVPESVFSQDNCGLAARKRRKHRFIAQQILMLLTQLAHNLCLWLKQWMIDAIEQNRQNSDWLLQISRQLGLEVDNTEALFQQTVGMLQQRGIKRFVHQLFSLSGLVKIKNGRLYRIVLNRLYPMIDRISVAFLALLEPYPIQVLLDKT